MVPIFHPRLVNDPFGDPCLYIDIQREGRAILFDLGSLDSLNAATAMRVSDIFVSHTHIDHFIGFDYLLRLFLGRDKVLRIFGPVGIIRNVEGKLSAYTWNLVEDYTFAIDVYEVSEGLISCARFQARDGFKRVEAGTCDFSDLLLEEPLFIVEGVHLDHKIPSLAFSIREKFHININKDVLNDMNLPVGPWLDQLKTMIREEAPHDTMVFVPDGRSYSVEELLEKRLVIISRGQMVTYVADAAMNDANREKIVRLAQGSDILFCEGAFLDSDREKALAKSHMTAGEAGRIAREAGVGRLEVFHFSPKYRKNPKELYAEAEREFRGYAIS